jgi:membrane protein implicated in regulation of membrane protease activity
MVLIFGALALMVGAVAALSLGSWWILVAVMAVHAVLSAAVIGFAYVQANKTGGKPDPVTEARLEEEQEQPNSDDARSSAAVGRAS